VFTKIDIILGHKMHFSKLKELKSLDYNRIKLNNQCGKISKYLETECIYNKFLGQKGKLK
jgi:hypothetical protein